MGSRGPQPTPTNRLKARGSWRAKVRESQGEPRPKIERPTCPAWLKGEARAEWNRQVKLLADVGCISKLDRAALAAYCEAWNEFVDLVERIKATGPLVLTDRKKLPTADGGEELFDVLKKNPLCALRDQAVKRLLQLADRFGFSPAARARLRVEDQQPAAAANSKSAYFPSFN